VWLADAEFDASCEEFRSDEEGCENHNTTAAVAATAVQ